MIMKKIFTFSLILTQIFLFSEADAKGDVSIFLKSPKQVVAGSGYTVEITINKSDISGFSKFESVLPFGFEAEMIEGSGASFVFTDNKAKFIWTNLPAEESFLISYKVWVPIHYSGDKKISGSFHYIYNNEKYTSNFSSILNIKNSEKNLIALKPELKQAKPVEIVYDEINNYCPELIFNVQLLALNTKASDEFLNELCDQSYRIKEDCNEGMYKYYTGGFYSLESAIEFRNNCGIKDAFIVVYYKGIRISISEAQEIKKNQQ